MWTASHQLDDLSLDLMHGGALEDKRVTWQPVDAECAQKRLCYGGKNTVGSRGNNLCIIFIFSK